MAGGDLGLDLASLAPEVLARCDPNLEGSVARARRKGCGGKRERGRVGPRDARAARRGEGRQVAEVVGGQLRGEVLLEEAGVLR